MSQFVEKKHVSGGVYEYSGERSTGANSKYLKVRAACNDLRLLKIDEIEERSLV